MACTVLPQGNVRTLCSLTARGTSHDFGYDKGDSEGKRFEAREAETEHQLTTLAVSSSRARWIRSKNCGNGATAEVLETTRRPRPEERAHQQAEIEPAGMDQQPLEDVGVTAQVGAAHTPGVVEVRERAFDQFAAPPHQTAAAWSMNPATIPIHRRLGFGRS